MSVPAPTVQADLRAALSKSIDIETTNRLVDDRVEKAGMVKDNRSMEDALGAADKWNGKTPEELAADPDALSKMSHQDILRAMGMEISDKGDSVLPEGDATVHDIDAALAEGKVTAMPESGQSAAPAATSAPAAAPAAPATSETQAPNDAAPAAKPNASAEPAAPESGEAPYIESRNGQGRIRYEVLQHERERRQAAEAELAQLRAKLNAGAAPAATPEKEPAATSAEPAAPQAAQPAARVPKLLTEQDITALRERFDDSIVDILVENNRIAVDAYERAARAEANLVERDSSSVVQQTQDYIDQDPLLSKWQTAKPDTREHALWQEAVATDEMLKALPGWADKPWQERIAEATRRVAVANGISIQAPAQNTAGKPSLQDRADAALQAARGHVQLPVSHSDLPAGTPPAQSERDSIGELNVHQLYDKLLAMTPEKQAEYLARVA